MVQVSKTAAIIANSFKQLTENNSLDTISITQIMEKTEFRRQTFYDHFDDKFDLIIWIYQTESRLVFQNIDTSSSIEQALYIVTQYFEDNYIFYKAIFTNEKTSSFKDFFILMNRNYIIKFLKNNVLFPESEYEVKEDLIDFINFGFSEMIFRWVLENCVPSAHVRGKELADLINFFLQSNQTLEEN